MMKPQGFASALGAPQQPQGNPQQAVQQLTQMLHMISGIHNEKTYQMAKQQFGQMGGDPTKLTKNYNKHEVDNFKKVLIKGINHLVGMAPQPQAPQAPQQPIAPGGTQPVQASNAPPPQEG